MEVLKADFKSSEAPNVFFRSFRDTGFAVVTQHPISKSLIDEVYSEWQSYFASNKKFDDLFDQATQSGYFPFKSENAKDSPLKDLKEFYHVYDGLKFPTELSDKTWALKNQLFELGQTLLGWIEELLPQEIRRQLSCPLKKMAEGSSKNLFRIIHYPPISEDEAPGSIRAAAHEDINLITLLPASTAMGLQVKDRQGNWFDVPGNYGDIVVNVGDMLQEATQSFFISTTHQVVNPQGSAAKTSRYSMPLFVHPHPEVRLSEKYTAESYLNERLKELGLK